MRQVGTEALHALAHPLRVRMFDELSARGAATASDLARRFGESTGATSYHLRQLARHRFIEEDPTRGTLRERYWRVVAGDLRLAGHDMMRSGAAATREAARMVTQEWHRTRTDRLDHWLSTATSWPAAWVDASLELNAHLRLRPEELAELAAELQAVTKRWTDRMRDRDDEDLFDVEVQVNAFPLEPPRRHDGLSSAPPTPPHAPPPAPPAGPPDPLPYRF